MTTPQLKYYLAKNPKYGAKKEPFVAPTREDYDEYLQIVRPGKAITPYERYVERSKEIHETPEEEILLKDIQMFGEDRDKIEEIENSDEFIRWY